MRKLITLLVVLVLLVGGAWWAAGYFDGPLIHVDRPARLVGAETPLDVVVQVPGGRLSSLRVEFEQNDATTTLVSFEEIASMGQIATGSDMLRAEGDTLHVARDVGRASVPNMEPGPARIVVTASRRVLYGLRDIETEMVHDVTVRLDPPRLAVMSTYHYINQGGSEVIVYRATPDDVESGVRVGDLEYPGYPASGVVVDGISSPADPSLRVAFFSLLYDQEPGTPMVVYARDEAGNTAEAQFDHRVFPKTFRQSRIQLDDGFIERVVPAILANTSDIAPVGETIDQYVAINSELRRKNAESIAALAADTSPEMLWRGVVFHPFTNNAVESGFADHRTYVYEGREVDRQVHLGFDLASVANAPIVAANHGKVLFAAPLGIYGNCVIIDHGMGLQSLYAHLSSMAVAPGDVVAKDQEIGRSGMTGLAGGDHLHFTMLVHGRMVNPIEWWDSHWIEDRILRKLRAAG